MKTRPFLIQLLAATFSLSVLSTAGEAGCKSDCREQYESDIDDCHSQYSDADDADDLQQCVQDAKDEYDSCIDDCDD